MTHNEQKDELLKVFKTLNDEEVINLWNAYHRILTCEMDECFFPNTEESRKIMFDVYGEEDVLNAIFHNNFGYNLSCEYFRFFDEPLIEGYSIRQARKLIRDDDLDAIANNLVTEQETLGIDYIRKIIPDIRGEVEDYLLSVDPMYLAELYCDYWNATHKGDMTYGGYAYFIREMESFDEDFFDYTPYEIAQCILNSSLHFNPNHKYYKMYKNRITTSDHMMELINFTELVNHIVTTLDPLSDVTLHDITGKTLDD